MLCQGFVAKVLPPRPSLTFPPEAATSLTSLSASSRLLPLPLPSAHVFPPSLFLSFSLALSPIPSHKFSSSLLLPPLHQVPTPRIPGRRGNQIVCARVCVTEVLQSPYSSLIITQNYDTRPPFRRRVCLPQLYLNHTDSPVALAGLQVQNLW